MPRHPVTERQFHQGERHSYVLADEDLECFWCYLPDCTDSEDTPGCPIAIRKLAEAIAERAVARAVAAVRKEMRHGWGD